MNEEDKKLLSQWARDEEAFLDEIVGRCELHKKILHERVKKVLRRKD